MHGVVGGGVMNRLLGDGSTYSQPHFVHCQRIEVILAFSVEEIRELRRWIDWDSHLVGWKVDPVGMAVDG